MKNFNEMIDNNFNHNRPGEDHVLEKKIYLL